MSAISYDIPGDLEPARAFAAAVDGPDDTGVTTVGDLRVWFDP